MFTGFASENTPAIQVWDFFNLQAGVSAVNRIALADDCAPIQYFKTGGNATAINLYLPSAPIEGKQITIVNANYTSTNQLINIYSSDASASGTTNPFISIGSGQAYNLCYSKNFILVNANGQFSTGWVSLNQSPIGAYAFNSIVLGGNNNSATGSRSAVVGGSVNTASGTSSSVVGGSSNTASSTSSAVVGGSSNVASGQNAGVFGGNNSSVSQLNAAALGGNSHQVTNLNAIVCGGTANIANGSGSIILAGSYGWARGIGGNTVSPASEYQ